jgi:hypothetical protein
LLLINIWLNKDMNNLRRITLTACIILSACMSLDDEETLDKAASSVAADLSKPRIINTTDLGADPDDEQSLVRQLVMADEYDLEGLIVSTGCWTKQQESTVMLDVIVDAYDEAYPNLMTHSAAFPTPEYLRSITAMGQLGYGMNDVGEGKDSVGSNMIIDAVDRDDPRPIWIMCWGGCNTAAQALHTVQKTRSEAELQTFVSKLHIYDVLGQDDAGTWIAKNFPDLLYIRATGIVYGWQPSDDWLQEHVQSHGALGAVYPDRKWASEGDTPAFLHVYPNGLNDPTKVSHGGWGGRFTNNKVNGIRGMECMKGEDDAYDPYLMHGDPAEGAVSINRWKDAIENDFEARMDWSITSQYDEANHHPRAILNGNETRDIQTLEVVVGQTVQLSAHGSSDPDKDSLSYDWSVYQEASSYKGTVVIENGSEDLAQLKIPQTSSGKNIHIVLEVKDDGEPILTTYRRIILSVQ